MSVRPARFVLRDVAAMAAIAGLYFFAARFGLSQAVLIPQISAVWPPTGIALAALILFGNRVWPAIFIGAFLANFLEHEPVLTALGIAGGNTTEGVLGANLLVRWVGFRPSLERVRDVVGLTVLGALLSPVASATIGVFSLWAGGLASTSNLLSAWWTWWIGDAMGALLVAPVLLTLGSRQIAAGRPARLAESVLSPLLILGVSYVVFTGLSETASQLKYLVFPPMIWAAVRLGQRAVSLSVLLVAGVAIWGALQAYGGLAETWDRHLLMLQSFMGVLAFTSLLTGALVSERAVAAEQANSEALAKADLEARAAQLRELAIELTRAEERERGRLAQMLHDGLQQSLVAAQIQLGAIARRITDEQLRSNMQDAVCSLSESIDQSRALAIDLSPPILFNSDLRGAFEWLGRYMRKRFGLEVRIQIDAEAGSLDGDLHRFLFHAARELLFNVVKHAGVREADLRVGMRNGWVEVAVEDAGAGFDPAGLGSGQFQRSFGLLSIRERLESLGGRFVVDSALGNGTRVALLAPVSAARQKAETPGLVREAARKRARDAIRVLLVDDHQAVREGIAKLLLEHGDIDVVGQAGSGEEAVASMESLAADVVVMDISLPGMSGIEATRRIGERCPQARVIGMSMHDEREVAAAMFAAGAVAYLTKSRAAEDLVNAIRSACNGSDSAAASKGTAPPMAAPERQSGPQAKK